MEVASPSFSSFLQQLPYVILRAKPRCWVSQLYRALGSDISYQTSGGSLILLTETKQHQHVKKADFKNYEK